MRSPLRSYGQGSGKQDVDAFERSNILQAAAWSLAGAGLGALAAVAAIRLQGWSGPAALLLAIVVWGAVFATPLAIASVGGRAGSTLYNPSGKSTSRRRGYSHAESLAARGLYEDAVAAYEVAIAEDPSDPEPDLRVARILRDELGRLEESARRFKAALVHPEASPGTRLLAARELVEVYEVRLGEPWRSAPLLARMAEEGAGTQAGDWAAAELRRVKAMIADQDGE